jgi:phosphoglycerol transferase MdoB-like AlkP superfamily enzyme
LFGCLLLNFFFEFEALNRWSWEARLLASSAIVASPIFFAALIFAKRFMTVTSPSLALASNLLGSLVGGVLEYLDMWTGLRWLNLVALLLYFISSLFLMRQVQVSRVESMSLTSQ